MFTFTASSGSVLPQNCAKFNMQHKNQPYKADNDAFIALCWRLSLAHDLTTSAQLKDIEERLRATEETLKELKRERVKA